jgi:hypothetical protein
MPDFLIALLLKPFILFVLCVFVLYPCRLLAMRFLPEGRLKRILLTRIGP